MKLKMFQKIEAYEHILHALHLASVMGNGDRIRELMKIISAWDFAHRCSNGEQSEKECQERINHFVTLMGEI